MAGPYYVDTAVGDDANAGTSEGSGNAWKTIDKAMNTVAAGEKVWVKATGTYVEIPTIDTAGTNTSPIVFEGYSSTTGDDGQVTISSGSTTNLSATLSLGVYYIFKNFIFDGGSGNACDPGGADVIMFVNCKFTNGGQDGLGGTGTNWMAFNCEFTNNTFFGYDNNSTSNSTVGNIFSGNGFGAVRMTQVTVLFYKNLLFDNGTGIAADLNGCHASVSNTIDGENTSTVGIDIDSDSTYPIVVDNIIYDCGTGVEFSSALWNATVFAGYNLLNSNTNDYVNAGGAEMVGWMDVTSAPGFTDEANDDYTLGDTSPAIDAGMQPGNV